MPHHSFNCALWCRSSIPEYQNEEIVYHIPLAYCKDCGNNSSAVIVSSSLPSVLSSLTQVHTSTECTKNTSLLIVITLAKDFAVFLLCHFNLHGVEVAAGPRIELSKLFSRCTGEWVAFVFINRPTSVEYHLRLHLPIHIGYY